MYKVGKVNYLNTLPIFYKWQDPQIELVEGDPSYLVDLLRNGYIQAGIVSSVEYLLNPQDYVYVPDVSISSRERVCSVLLFSNKPIQTIDSVFLTPASLTSKYLCMYVLEEVYNLKPHYLHNQTNADALLFIGDEALNLKKLGIYPYVYDLAYEWYKVHRLPFVFALFLVRKDYADNLLDRIEKLCNESIDRFLMDLKLGNIQVKGFTRDEVKEYFTHCLDIRLNDRSLESMNIFREFLKKKEVIFSFSNKKEV